jgi:hypothetical protein
MALPKKKKDGFALLLGEPEKPEDSDPDAVDDFDEGLDDEDLPEDDALSLEGDAADPLEDLDEEASSIDPEQAALCETLGFTDPEQQQALIDLVRLVNSPDPLATESSSSLPPLPESSY